MGISIFDIKEEVYKFQCRVLQSFIKLIIKDGWQEGLYKKSKNEVENRGKFQQTYKPIYSRMNDIGRENYTVEMMDVTACNEVVLHLKDYIPQIDSGTKKAIECIHRDRNDNYGHDNSNESNIEMCRNSLVALKNIEQMIKCVRDYETGIDETKRNAFWDEYSPKIKKLKTQVEEEYAKRVEMQKYIQSLANCKDYRESAKIWIRIFERFFPRGEQADFDGYYGFAKEASNAGVRKAHFEAFVGSLGKNQYEECEKYLKRIYDSSIALEESEAKTIVESINHRIGKGESIPNVLKESITKMIAQGFPIEIPEKGYILWNNKPIGGIFKLVKR